MKIETEKLISEVMDDFSKKNENEEQHLIKFLESLWNEQNATPTGGKK